MKIGISQLIAADPTVEGFLRTSAEAGYECAELAMKTKGPLTPDTDDAALDGYAAVAKDLGIDICSVTMTHCTGNLLAQGPAREKSLEETRIGLRAAARLGARCVLHTLGRLSPELYYDDAYRNGVQSLRELAPQAEELGLEIGFEFVWNGFLFSPMEVARFLDEVGSPAVGFYFDPGNMAVFQYPQHWVRIVGPRIKCAHLKDWTGHALNGKWTPLLEGSVDFPCVMAELRKTGYDGPLISEVSPDLAWFADTAKTIRRIIEL